MVQFVPSEIVIHPPEIKSRRVNEPEPIHTADPVAEHGGHLGHSETANHSDNHSAGNENRQPVPAKIDRRTYCRRIYHWPVLEELRSHVERRQHDEQGWGSPVTHIDEEV
ncbi:MAG TPA: hypothetical protein PLK99_02515 [Burkholderiales bacterium]|nr:hypothetical protein [Burkholderiales bacterium]